MKGGTPFAPYAYSIVFLLYGGICFMPFLFKRRSMHVSMHTNFKYDCIRIRNYYLSFFFVSQRFSIVLMMIIIYALDTLMFVCKGFVCVSVLLKYEEIYVKSVRNASAKKKQTYVQ